MPAASVSLEKRLPTRLNSRHLPLILLCTLFLPEVVRQRLVLATTQDAASAEGVTAKRAGGPPEHTKLRQLLTEWGK